MLASPLQLYLPFAVVREEPSCTGAAFVSGNTERQVSAMRAGGVVSCASSATVPATSPHAMHQIACGEVPIAPLMIDGL